MTTTIEPTAATVNLTAEEMVEAAARMLDAILRRVQQLSDLREQYFDSEADKALLDEAVESFCEDVAMLEERALAQGLLEEMESSRSIVSTEFYSGGLREKLRGEGWQPPAAGEAT